MKKILFSFLVCSSFLQLYSQTLPPDDTTSPIDYTFSVSKSNDQPPVFAFREDRTVGMVEAGVARSHTGCPNDNYFQMPMEQPSSPPFAVEIAKVFVGCNLSYVSGGSLEIYAAIDRFSDATQAWNSPSLMTKMATKSTTGPNETEVTGTAFTTMKTWLEFRQTNIKKIYFTLKESDETKYVIVSDFYIRVQYRYKYQIFVSMDRAYDGSIGTVTGSLSYGGAAQQINLHTSTFTFYRNEVASFNLNPTTAIGAQQYGYNNSILTGSGYSNSGISQRQYPITLSSSTFVSIFYVPGVWVTLDNQVNFLNGSSARITGSTLKASQGGQDIQTVSAGNPVLVPQDVGIDYTTLYGNSGEDLNYIYNSTAYRVKHQNWNNDLGSAKLTYTSSTHFPPPTPYTAYYAELKQAAASMNFEGVSQSGQSLQFKDPWRVIGGPQPSNWDTYTSGSSLGIGNAGTTVAGVFLHINYYAFHPNNAHYSVKADASKSLNNVNYYFTDWSGSDVQIYTPTSTESPVTFNSASSVITADYKGHLITGRPDFADAKNQRRIASLGSAWVMVYESMGDVWLSYSYDNGVTWSSEQRLNFIVGQACNPTISNVDNIGRATVAWIERNSQGLAELYLQNIWLCGVSGGGIWFGWNPSLGGVRTSQTYTTFNTIHDETPIGSPIQTRTRLDSRPVLFISSILNSILIASEASGSGIMAANVLLTSNEFNGAFVPGNGLFTGVRTISTNTYDQYPVIVSYPSAYSYPLSQRIFYLAAGYASGRRIAQYDFNAVNKTSLVTGEYGEYTYYSLQGAVSPTSASFVLVAEETNMWTGVRNVCVFGKPTYYGSSLPTLWTVYTNMSQPTVMTETGSFGTSPYEVAMKANSDGKWWKSPGYGSPTLIGPSIAGFFERELVVSGDRASIVVNNASPAPPAALQRYSGSGAINGGLNKTSGTFAESIRSFQFREDASKNWKMSVLDFGGANVDIIDSLAGGNILCVARYLDTPANTIVSQVDSLAIPLTLEVDRGGKAFRSFAASSWKRLSRNSISNLQADDLIKFTLPGKSPDSSWGYKEITLIGSGLEKDGETTSDDLIPTEFSIGVFPNPFNPSTTFRISLPQADHVRLAVYNMLGQQVGEVVNADLEAGIRNLRFVGNGLSSGTYIYRLKVGDKLQTGKLMLLK